MRGIARKLYVYVLVLSVVILLCSCEDMAAYSSEEATTSDKIILTLACSNERMFPTALVEHFNDSQDTYEIQGVFYQNAEDAEERLAQLQTDIENHLGPDIILADCFFLTQNTSGVSDFLEDLRPYIDADDELSWESFLPAVMDTYAPNGNLYITASDFSIQALHIRASVEAPIYYNDYFDLVRLYGTDNIEYYPHNLGAFILTSALMGQYTSQTWQPDFPNSEIRAAFQLYKTLYNQEPDYQINPKGIMYYSTLYSFSDLQFWRAAFGEDVTLTGFPGQTGGTLVCPVSHGYGINKNSTNKDGAWQFLRVLLTASYQDENKQAFPTNIEAFENQIRFAQADGDEEIILPFSVNLEYQPVEDADIEAIVELINNTTELNTSYSLDFIHMYEKVFAYAAQYVRGELSLDDAMNQLQADMVN